MIPPALSAAVTSTGPFAASESLPFGLPPKRVKREASESPRPLRRPWIVKKGAALPRLDESVGSGNNSRAARVHRPPRRSSQIRSELSNFQQASTPWFRSAENVVRKLDMSAMSSCGLLRETNVSKSQLSRENIVSEHELVPKESFLFLPGLGFIKPGRDFRDTYNAGPIQRVLLLALTDVPLSDSYVPQHLIHQEIRRTVQVVPDRRVIDDRTERHSGLRRELGLSSNRVTSTVVLCYRLIFGNTLCRIPNSKMRTVRRLLGATIRAATQPRIYQ